MCPLYNYECSDCGFQWEEVFSIEDRCEPMGKPCPACETETIIKRLIQPVMPARHLVINPMSKMSTEFKDTMTRIKSEHPYMRSKYF